MSEPGPKTELLGQIAYQFFLLSPILPTYIHVVGSALFAIYTGAHASLSRPSSAAKPPKKRIRRRDGRTQSESTQRMEGLSPADAILYPILTGSMLVGLYYLIKWLKDPEILNKIINWYLSVFGIFSISKLLTDGINTVRSFVFPARYQQYGIIWKVNRKRRVFTPARLSHIGPWDKELPPPRKSPLPGLLYWVPLHPWLQSCLWWLRDGPARPFCVIRAFLRGVFEATIPVSLQGIFGLLAAICSVLYFNLVGKPWWLTNLLGFSFCYSALQLMSPTTFWTGTLVLTALFFYDIYFVFFTPIMISVATKLDVPVKLLFPRPPGADEDPNKQSLAMLGLGDIVLPGIMIGLALRFDLHLFYARKQRQRQGPTPAASDKEGPESTDLVPSNQKFLALSVNDALIYDAAGLGKAEYKNATGGWGERFWSRNGKCECQEGGIFPKTYFYASIIGYVAGMVCTLGIMHVFQHGQPALLYLVPGVLLSLWGTALVRGELKDMWEYTELDEEEAQKATKAGEKPAVKAKGPAEAVPENMEEKGNRNEGKLEASIEAPPPKDHRPTIQGQNSASEAIPSSSTAGEDQSPITNHTLFTFSIDLPDSSTSKAKARNDVKIESALGEDLKAITPGALVGGEGDSSSDSSTSRRISVVYYDREQHSQGEPPEKRRKIRG